MENNYIKYAHILLGLTVWLCVSIYAVNKQFNGLINTPLPHTNSYKEEIKFDIHNRTIAHQASIGQEITDGRLHHARASDLVTMFTTIKASPFRKSIHENTINNWAALGIGRFLFVDNQTKDWAGKAYNAGWSIDYLPSSHLRHNVPIIRRMFQTMETTVDTPFIGYANADIVFDR